MPGGGGGSGVCGEEGRGEGGGGRGRRRGEVCEGGGVCVCVRVCGVGVAPAIEVCNLLLASHLGSQTLRRLRQPRPALMASSQKDKWKYGDGQLN